MEEAEDIEALEQDLYVQVHVEAEDEDDQFYRWSCRVPCCKPLFAMRAQWAEAHGVTEVAVGFEDYLDREVDLQRTPLELGWSSKMPVHLHAVPVDDRFAEGAEGELPVQAPKPQAAPGSAKSEPSAAEAPGAKRAKRQPPAPAALPAPAPQPAPAAPPAPVPAAEEPAAAAAEAPAEPPRAEAPIAAALARAQAASEQVAEAAPPVKFSPLLSCTTTIDLDDEPGTDSGFEETGRSSSSFPASASTCTTPPGTGDVQAQAPALATAETAAAPLRKRGRAAGASGDGPSSGSGLARRDRGSGGAMPSGSDSIAFDVRNPKKVGTQSYERYEKYKVATTPKEALQLGAIKGDLQNDFKKGYMKRC